MRLGEATIAGGEFAALLVPAIADLLAGAGVVGQGVGWPCCGGWAGELYRDSGGDGGGEGDGRGGRFAGCDGVAAGAAGGVGEGFDFGAGCASGAVVLRHVLRGFRAERDAADGWGDQCSGGLAGGVAVCEETVAQLLEELHGEPDLVRVAGPTAYDAMAFSTAKWRAKEYADVATLDGYYLRGADAKTQAALAAKVR